MGLPLSRPRESNHSRSRSTHPHHPRSSRHPEHTHDYKPSRHRKQETSSPIAHPAPAHTARVHGDFQRDERRYPVRSKREQRQESEAQMQRRREEWYVYKENRMQT
ncbi:MAG: hypothetical protein LQ341_005558, partial [Variospora aurantia]